MLTSQIEKVETQGYMDTQHDLDEEMLFAYTTDQN